MLATCIALVIIVAVGFLGTQVNTTYTASLGLRSNRPAIPQRRRSPHALAAPRRACPLMVNRR